MQANSAKTAGADQAANEIAKPTEVAVEPANGVNSILNEELLDSVIWNLLPGEAQTHLQFLSHYPLLLIAGVVSLGYLLGKLLQFVLAQIGHRIARHTETKYDDELLKIARRPVMTIPVVLSLLMVTTLLGLSDGLHGFIVGFLATIMMLSFLRALLKGSHVLLEMLASRKDSTELIQPRTIPMFEISLKLILVALAGYLLLAIWGIDPTAWLASAGVIGIAVGFAARDTLANLFSGIFIVADAPYKIGDYIVLDTGERGEVTQLGMRSTRLLTRDDIEVTIPNAIIANAKIINESGGPWEKHRIRIPVGVAYDSDVDRVTQILGEVATDNADMLDYPGPRVRMRRFGDSALEFELMGWIQKPQLRGRVRHEMLMELVRRFRAAGITIPFPQRTVHLPSQQEKDQQQDPGEA